ncbi:MAG: hypothetical protein AWU55_1647 [Halomonadaceae bacterium T82-2]|nr:MAG: hypothetical protein AWU55_1647 [Halomonadaceae bacterium T82-2]
MEGRSPRVRGSLLPLLGGHIQRGSIPAGAGKPHRPAYSPPGNRVDPRGCGEARHPPRGDASMKGRSPRVRGSPRGGGRRPDAGGSIPAGAGKPITKGPCLPTFGVDPRGCGEAAVGHAWRPILRVDPRGCGEAQIQIDDGSPTAGRSPRVRGSPAQQYHGIVDAGSIPAGAGKPSAGRCWTPSTRVDPRGCGEASGRVDLPTFEWGRSPRVRGSLTHSPSCEDALGSIPAGAGKPTCCGTGWCPAGVDPRGCGEARSSTCAPTDNSGRSPRVRGSPGRGKGSCRRPGSIPAGAGKPQQSIGTASLSRVDPRGCGEAEPTFRASTIAEGRSPRVRGSP